MHQIRRTGGLRHWVHWALMAGVAASGALLVIGLILVFTFRQSRAEGSPPGLGELLAAALGGNGPAIIDLGLLLLICTPLFRVAVLAVGWLATGDFRFAAVALAVFGLLILSLVLGVG
jgi:uncharacterized membrane protein